MCRDRPYASANAWELYPKAFTGTANDYKFTGHERDTESGLDHTLYRQYSSGQGRWLAPDPKRGSPANPQSWNRYTYGNNSPCNYVDRNGAYPEEVNPFWNYWGVLGRNPRFPPIEENQTPDELYEMARQQLREDLLHQAIIIAMIALNNPACGGLFEDFEGGMEPWQVLDALYTTTWEKGRIVFDDPGHFKPGQIGGTFAVNLDGTIPERNPNTGRYNVVWIRLNDDLWNGAGDIERAKTLIHELGHFYNDVSGGGKSLFQPDGMQDPEKKQQADEENRLLEQICFPK